MSHWAEPAVLRHLASAPAANSNKPIKASRAAQLSAWNRLNTTIYHLQSHVTWFYDAFRHDAPTEPQTRLMAQQVILDVQDVAEALPQVIRKRAVESRGPHQASVLRSRVKATAKLVNSQELIARLQMVMGPAPEVEGFLRSAATITRSLWRLGQPVV